MRSITTRRGFMMLEIIYHINISKCWLLARMIFGCKNKLLAEFKHLSHSVAITIKQTFEHT